MTITELEQKISEIFAEKTEVFSTREEIYAFLGKKRAFFEDLGVTWRPNLQQCHRSVVLAFHHYKDSYPLGTKSTDSIFKIEGYSARVTVEVRIFHNS